MGVGATEDCPRIKWIISTALAYFRREVAGTDSYDIGVEKLLREDLLDPGAAMHALPSYGEVFHHFTTTPPDTTHLGTLGNDEISELRVQSRIEGQRAVSIEHDHIILTNGRLDCNPGTIIVTCTGPTRDPRTRARLQAEHTAMRDTKMDPMDVDSVTLFTILAQAQVPRSSYFLAELYFAYSDPSVALKVIKENISFLFGYGSKAFFFHLLRSNLKNQRYFESLGMDGDMFSLKPAKSERVQKMLTPVAGHRWQSAVLLLNAAESAAPAEATMQATL
eukprot:2870081-Prymnesium_polylepis.1